ncbi:MAG TPA: hypothetical protein VF597_00670 [Candidatus Saccharimonadales bacterium]
MIAIAALSGGILYKFYGFDGIFIVMLIIQILATYLAFLHYKNSQAV